MLSLAGVWEYWRKDEGAAPVVSFTVITTGAGSMMSHLHIRAPVILLPADVDRWLDPAAEPDHVHGLLSGSAESALVAHPVSRKVNSPRDNGPALIEAVAEEPRDADERAPEPPTLFR